MSQDQNNGPTEREGQGPSRHTPGPWHAILSKYENDPTWSIERLVAIESGGDDTVCGIWGRPETPKQEANARLIAAAPDMLAALKLALQFIDNSGSPGGCDGSHSDCAHCCAIDQVRTVIAKALPSVREK